MWETSVTHICGHPGRRKTSGSAQHRELVARAFAERPCGGCTAESDFVPRAMLRALARAEIESRHLPPLVGDTPEDELRASAVRACFVDALERYRPYGLVGSPGDELEALLRETLQGFGRDMKRRFGIVNDWLQDRGLESDGRPQTLAFFAWHLGRIRLSDETTPEIWIYPACGYVGGPLDGSMRFFARLNLANLGRPTGPSAE